MEWTECNVPCSIYVYTGKKSTAVTGKLILVTAKHLARNEQVNERRSLNQLK